MLKLKKQDICRTCLETKDDGFAFLAFDDICERLNGGDEAFIRCWTAARAFKAGESVANWTEQKACAGSKFVNDEFVEYEGWSRKGFLHKFRQDPVNLGMDPVL